MDKDVRDLLIMETVRNNPVELSTSFFLIDITDDKGTKTVASIPTEFCEKFAEVVIRECTNRISKWETAYVDKNGKVHHGEIGKDIVDDINQYFDIE